MPHFRVTRVSPAARGRGGLRAGRAEAAELAEEVEPDPGAGGQRHDRDQEADEDQHDLPAGAAVAAEDAPLVQPVADVLRRGAVADRAPIRSAGRPVPRPTTAPGDLPGTPAGSGQPDRRRLSPPRCSWPCGRRCLLYSVRPMVSVLMLSSRTRMAPTTIVILATCRLYQPDTRSMWSSYQFSTEVRNEATSSPAFVARACSDVLERRHRSRAAADAACETLFMVVSPAASGTSRSMMASLNDLGGDVGGQAPAGAPRALASLISSRPSSGAAGAAGLLAPLAARSDSGWRSGRSSPDSAGSGCPGARRSQTRGHAPRLDGLRAGARCAPGSSVLPRRAGAARGRRWSLRHEVLHGLVVACASLRTVVAPGAVEELTQAARAGTPRAARVAGDQLGDHRAKGGRDAENKRQPYGQVNDPRTRHASTPLEPSWYEAAKSRIRRAVPCISSLGAMAT